MAKSPAADAVYEAADIFRKRCLQEGTSFIWPDQPIWNQANLNQLWHRIHPHLHDQYPHTKDSLANALNGAPDEVLRISADLVTAAVLYPSLHSAHKKLAINNALASSSIELPSNIEMSSVWSGLRARIPGGQNYHRGTLFGDWAYFLRFSQRAMSSTSDLSDPYACRAFADETLHDPGLSHDGQRIWTQPRHALLHLFFPNTFVGVVNKQHRSWILNQFSHDAGVPQGTDDDTALNMIREHLSNEYAVDPFDFYNEAIKTLWFRGKASSRNNGQIVETEEDELMFQNHAPYQALMDATHLSSMFLQDIDDLLLDKRQLIFEGPPGSGKTYVAEEFARWFTGQNLDGTSPLNEQVEIVQFHQSYGYEDFVQGIRPRTNEHGQLIYQVEKGIFLEMCERAIANSGKPFVLMIDEINRGNLSRIFGELLLLLEYRGMSVRLPYGDDTRLTIPENLYIIGTMNTADRSLAQIDYALRRRFYFVRFMPVEDGRAYVFENWLNRQGRMSYADRSRLHTMFVDLNEGISAKLNSADLQVGHSYFMTDTIETEAGLDRVWTRAVAPLLNEYLYHHRDREEILAALTPAALVRQTSGSSTKDEVPPDSPDADDEAGTHDPDQ
jgi:hypothetical protein